MRIMHKNVKVTKILFHPFLAFLYCIIFFYFVYSNYKLFPVWVAVQDRLENSKKNYEKKLSKKENIEIKNEINQSEEGQKRYRKEFFNELDEGEKLIILYNEKEEVKKDIEVIREMSFFGKWKLKIKLWWANL